MNILISELSQKENLQRFLHSFLDHLQKYFETRQPMSEAKTYQDIDKISIKIKKYFPEFKCIDNICEKLKFNVGDRINDKYEKNDKAISKKQNSSLLSLLHDQNIDQFQTDEAQQQIDFGWVRKALLEQIKLFKEDLQEDNEVMLISLQKKIHSQDRIVFMDSYLNNSKIMQQIAQNRLICSFKEVKHNSNQISKPQSQILLTDVSRWIRKASKVIISAESISKDGGILGSSGSLMLAINAINYGVPVIVVTRCFCLSKRIILGQQSLVEHINPSDNFANSNDQSQKLKVHIAKRLEYVPARYISCILTEAGESSPKNIESAYRNYYEQYQ